MPRSVEVLDETEELAALQAVETVQALRKAMKAAPHGRGLATVEAVVRDKGFEHLRNMLETTLRDHPEAQKGGSAPETVPAAERPVTGTSRPSSS